MINSYERPYTSARSTFNNIDEATIRQIFDIDSLRKSLFERKEEAREAGWDKMRKVYITSGASVPFPRHRISVIFSKSKKSSKKLLKGSTGNL
jgi:hypothetical protein